MAMINIIGLVVGGMLLMQGILIGIAYKAFHWIV